MSIFGKSKTDSYLDKMNAMMMQQMQAMYVPYSASFTTGANDEPEAKKLQLPHYGEVQTEPIIAYRAWSYQGGVLGGIGYQMPWPYDGAMRAGHAAMYGNPYGYTKCPAGGIYKCESCGIYGFKTVDALKQCFKDDVIFGRVALWGKVVEHEDGYRATRAYPQVLYVHNERMEPLVRALADLYGVDVTPLPQVVARPYNALMRVREELTKLQGANSNG